MFFAGLFGLMAVEAGMVSEDVRLTEIIPEFKGAGAFGEMQRSDTRST